MLNLNDLEHRWLRYKIKVFIPYILILLSLTIIAIILFTMNFKKEILTDKLTLNNHKSITKKESTIPIQTPDKEINTTTKPKEIFIKQSEKLMLSPSLNFMNQIQNNTTPEYQTNNISKKTKNIKLIEPKLVQTSKTTFKPTLDPSPVKEDLQKETTINITKRTTTNDINEVVKRFNKNNNPTLSLFIAKKYYEIGDYRKSYNYALITNEINNDIEASWVIFAKSLVKLNETEMAIKVLNEYIKQSNSNRAYLLLDKIQSGKFK